MPSIIAPPEILSAMAVAAVDQGVYPEAPPDGDPDLSWGTHLRIYAGHGASFPLTPFPVFRVKSRIAEFAGLHVTGAPRHDGGGFALEDGVAAEMRGRPGWSPENCHLVRLDLDPGGDEIDHAELLDQRGRIVAGRDKPHWKFSAPVIQRLRIRGRASRVAVTPRVVDIGPMLDNDGTRDLAAVLGFPLHKNFQPDGLFENNWYLAIEDYESGLRRAGEGGPRRLNPMDQPVGPLKIFEPGDDQVAERIRVDTLLREDGEFDTRLSNMVYDQRPPWRQVDFKASSDQTGYRRQDVHTPPLGIMQLAALDPGMARFLGLAARLDEYPNLGDDDWGSSDWDTLAVIGLIAYDPKEFEKAGVVVDPQQHPEAEHLFALLGGALRQHFGRDMRPYLHRRIAWVRAQGLQAAPFITFAAPVLPWLAPALPKPEIVSRHWQHSDGKVPSSLWRAGFAFDDPPIAGMTALARDSGGGFQSRNRMIETPLMPRAIAGLMGVEREPNARLRVLGQRKRPQRRAGLLSDRDIPAESGAVTYLASIADPFGRFGPPVSFAVDPPPRPMPPPPVLRHRLERPENIPIGRDPASPGALVLQVAVPHPAPGPTFRPAEEQGLASAIIVPRLDDLPAGALPLVRLELRLDGETRSVALDVPGMAVEAFPLRPLAPGKRIDITLEARYVDSAGHHSQKTITKLVVEDLRPPEVVPTGIGLFWTSQPGPSPEVEIAIAWKAAANSRHRVYLADANGLGLTGSGAGVSRGEIGVKGCRGIIDGVLQQKKLFRLLTYAPLQADADGRVVLRAPLPRSLSTVQFLRVVPIGSNGAEPDFKSCGIVPVAVPESRRPASPRLEGAVDARTGLGYLSIVADGLNAETLIRDEPGLFDPALPGGEPPRFRLRHAISEVPDPVYARFAATGPLAPSRRNDGSYRFSASIETRPLEPFVRHVWWAEIAMPPERRVPADTVAIEPPGGVIAVDPAARRDAPRPFSLPSAPLVLMHVPADPPDAPHNVEAGWKAQDAHTVLLSLSIADPPRAHSRAVAPYRVAIWAQWGGSNLEPVGSPAPIPDDGPIEATFAAPADPANALSLRLAYLDPMGRMGATASVVATQLAE